MAADYQNAAPPNLGMNYQPQVPDTTFGPMTHIHRPRFDPPGLVAVQPAISVSVQSPPAVMVPQPGIQVAMGPVFQPPIMAAPIPMPGAVQIPAPVAAVTGPPVILQQPVPSAPMVMPAGPPMAVAPGMAVGPGISVAPGMAVGSGVAVAPGMAPMPGAFPAMPAAVAGQPGMILQGNSGVWPEPACGIGRTGTEYAAEQMEMAYANKSFEPQDFKPADDNPSRMYMCRELDGNWTLRSRYSIDRMGNEWRWHMAPEGYFYAVRLPN